MSTLRLSGALAALTLTASATCAAVIDLGNGLGPSGGYASQAYYQTMLGGQPMTAAQQAYSNQEDQLRQMGFLAELGGDIALGQMFYHMAYGLTAPLPPSALDFASGGSGPGSPLVTPSVLTPSGLAAGASNAGATGGAAADGDYDGSLVEFDDGGSTTNLGPMPFLSGSDSPNGSAPEPSTWAMMAIGFAALGLMGWRPSRQAAA